METRRRKSAGEPRPEEIRLRGVEARDVGVLLGWENDPAVWEVSGTVRPYTREEIEAFIARQQAGFFVCGQLRLMIEVDGRLVGAVDLFEYDPATARAGVGILIADPGDRRRGYGLQALESLDEYARELGLHELWCKIAHSNEASSALFRRAKYNEKLKMKNEKFYCFSKRIK